MKEKYNYTRAWRNPLKIYNIKTWVKFRNGIRLITLLILGFLYLLFYILDNKYNLYSLFGMTYYVIPVPLTYYVATRNIDGKNILMFFIDYIKWSYRTYYKKYTYSYDKPIFYKRKNNRFR